MHLSARSADTSMLVTATSYTCIRYFLFDFLRHGAALKTDQDREDVVVIDRVELNQREIETSC